MDTHSQSIRTDPEIYLPGEVDTGDDDDSDSDDNDEDDEDDGEDQDDSAKIFPGMKRKATSRTRGPKYVKRKTQAAPSTAALGVIDDRRPDLTLIDVPVGESVLSHPYGRHGCLFMEVKVDANKKPNPQEVVSRLFFGIPITKACLWTGPEESGKETQRHPQKCCRSADSQVYPASDCGHRPAPPRYPSFHALLPPHHTVWYHI